MIAITNANIITMADKTIENGDIIIKDGKIKRIGKNLDLTSIEKIIDATNKIVLPGFVDAHTHIGIGEEDIGWAGRDFDEDTDPVTPHLRALDAINPQDTGFVDSLMGGVTTAMVTPGSSNIFGGICTVIKTQGDTIDKMILKEEVGLKAALGENPKRDYGVKQNKTPKTRMGIAAIMREEFYKAIDYRNEKKQSKNDGNYFCKDMKYESILKVLDKTIPLKIHAHRADDIITAIRIKNEFNINITIEHGTEGHLVVDEIVKNNISVLVGPTLGERSKNELKNKTFATPGILSKAGVKVGIISDHGVVPAQYLPLYAGLAIREGMNELDALKSITINPAEILGIDDRVGSLEEGKDADIVIYSGSPFDTRSKIDMVLINGNIVNK